LARASVTFRPRPRRTIRFPAGAGFTLTASIVAAAFGPLPMARAYTTTGSYTTATTALLVLPAAAVAVAIILTAPRSSPWHRSTDPRAARQRYWARSSWLVPYIPKRHGRTPGRCEAGLGMRLWLGQCTARTIRGDSG
jgi:hypothetical protein